MLKLKEKVEKLQNFQMLVKQEKMAISTIRVKVEAI